MLGIKTIGNATLIVYDQGPLLATDPWFGDEDDAFFGSWGLSHQIPAAEKNDILKARYVWFSHGHPDHLNPRSLERLRHASILLPDHVGGRIKNDLLAGGYNARTLPDGRWVELSRRVKVFCLCDYMQDSVLLVDVGGRLFIDMNDCGARARLPLIAKIARGFRHSYLLRLSGYGDAGMINLFDAQGNRLEPKFDRLVGRWLSQYAQRVGAKAVIPFSSFHRYERQDSAWANAYTTPLCAYRAGFEEKLAEFIAPFVWIDCASGEVLPLDPPEPPHVLRTPEECGDSWSDELDADDKRVLDDYFRRKQALPRLLGYLAFTVGGKTHTIGFDPRLDRGITFEVPRNSLMSAVSNRVFDDLSGGNFMRTTLHNFATFYSEEPFLFAPNFDCVVGKYADNGGAETRDELKAYLAEYRKRAGAVWLLHQLTHTGQSLFRRYAKKHSKFYSIGSDVYRRVLRS